MAAINPRTKVICLSYIHTFSGYAIDVAAIGQICQKHGILFVLNLSQAAGAFPVDISALPIDALVCAGYKWLLGPYGTGFCWMKKEVREKLEYPQNYWISLMDEVGLSHEGPLLLKEDRSSRRYDIFGTANFFNYVPWRASIEYLLAIGLDQVHAHNQQLVDQIIDGIDSKNFYFVSPIVKGSRTNIIVFSHQQASHNSALFEYLKTQGLHLALWKGKLRIAPHIYNTPQDIDRFLSVLNSYEPK